MKYSFNVYQQDPPHILPLELAAGGREVLPKYLALLPCACSTTPRNPQPPTLSVSPVPSVVIRILDLGPRSQNPGPRTQVPSTINQHPEHDLPAGTREVLRAGASGAKALLAKLAGLATPFHRRRRLLCGIQSGVEPPHSTARAAPCPRHPERASRRLAAAVDGRRRSGAAPGVRHRAGPIAPLPPGRGTSIVPTVPSFPTKLAPLNLITGEPAILAPLTEYLETGGVRLPSACDSNHSNGNSGKIVVAGQTQLF